MTLEAELGPKLTRIRTLVEDWLAGIDEHVFTDDPSSYPHPLVDGAGFPGRPIHAGELRNAVDMLIARFEGFYKYDTDSFKWTADRLYGSSLEVLASGAITDPGPASYSVFGLIAQAENDEMDRIDGLIGLTGTVNDNGEYAQDVWIGDGATAFFNGFVVPFHKASVRQRALAAILALIARVCDRAVKAIQQDIMVIADYTVALFEVGIGGGTDHPAFEVDPGEVIATVDLLLTLVFPDPKDYFVTYAEIFSGEAFEREEVVLPSQLARQAGNEVNLLGDGRSAPPRAPEEIIYFAWGRIDALEELIDEGDRHINRQLHELLWSTSSPFVGGAMDVARPELADGGNPFGEVAVADPAANAELVTASVAGIYQAGYEVLPSAANQYQAAARLLEQSDDYPVGCLAWSRLRLSSALQDLAGSLDRISESMAAAGATLVDIASGYEFVDGSSAATFRELIAEVSDPWGTPTPLHGEAFAI